MEKQITITKEEYESLLLYKDLFMDMMQIKKKSGNGYKKYLKYKDMEIFFKSRYGETYKVMVQEYEKEKKLSNYEGKETE